VEHDQRVSGAGRGQLDPAAFARDGVACVRQVLDPGEVAAAAAAIEAVLVRPGPLAQVASGADDPGAFVEDFCRWREIPQIEQLARHSRVPAVAAALMATPQVRFYHDHVLVKEGRTTQRTPWHQDQPYYNVDGRGVSAWITVDPVPEGGSLELVAGSHRGPWLMPRTLPGRRRAARAAPLAYLAAVRRPGRRAPGRVGHGSLAVPGGVGLAPRSVRNKCL
jgi:ectoine hydroxylase-related dioxygenase (phytanoyl-CoA dioxygenase family)